MKKILMIEDDRGLVRIIGDRLRAEGYDFTMALDGITGKNMAMKGCFDILLVDLMLPGESGFDIIRELRSRGILTPIIILSAKFQMTDKVSGFRLGADDYLVKPFEFDELLARIEAQLRRKEFNNFLSMEEVSDWLDLTQKDFSFGPFVLSFHHCQLNEGRKVIPLSKLEFRLLAYLIMNRERVVPNEELLNQVWNYDDTISTRTLYVHIAWLRKKTSCKAYDVPVIETVRGMGYRFSLEEASL